MLKEWREEIGIVLLLFVTVCITAFVTSLVIETDAVVDTGIGDEERVVPATGAVGYPVDVFCKDPDTKVYFEQPLPEIRTYTLTRLKDGVNESVIWNPGPSGDNTSAKHYVGTGTQQVDQDAAVNEAARKCIEQKAVVR